MKRKNYCELDEEDIIQIIAEHFNVDRGKVEVRIGHEVIGVGPMEHERHYVECKVELPANEMR